MSGRLKRESGHISERLYIMHSVVQKLEVLVMGDVCVQVCAQTLTPATLRRIFISKEEIGVLGGEGWGFH